MTPKAALIKAVELAGGQTEYARKLSEATGEKVVQQNVWSWLNRVEQLPGEFAIPTEVIVHGEVSRSDLCPKLYPRESAA